MTIDNVKEEDSLIIDTVVKENGVVKDITGGTVLGAVRDPNNNIITTGIVGSIPTGTDGVARVTIAKDIFAQPGSWLGQGRLEIGTESKTFWSEDINIGDSIIKDA